MNLHNHIEGEEGELEERRMGQERATDFFDISGKVTLAKLVA